MGPLVSIYQGTGNVLPAKICVRFKTVKTLTFTLMMITNCMFLLNHVTNPINQKYEQAMAGIKTLKSLPHLKVERSADKSKDIKQSHEIPVAELKNAKESPHLNVENSVNKSKDEQSHEAQAKESLHLKSKNSVSISKNEPKSHHVWPLNQTRSVKLLIEPDLPTALILPKAFKDKLNVVVVVCSSVKNFAARTTIRSSWAQDQHKLDGVRVVFLLGEDKQGRFADSIKSEAVKHGDIIQESFVDIYSNLTIKSLMLLKWSTGFYNGGNAVADYVFKADDDCYVNLPQLVSLTYELKSRKSKMPVLMGNVYYNPPVVRDSGSKWYSPWYMFNGTRYPTYLHGASYLIELATAVKLLAMAINSPVFHMEDVYLTGILAEKVKIQRENRWGLLMFRAVGRDYVTFCQVISIHNVEHDKMIEIYEELQISPNCLIMKM